ncbi:MAG: glycosyltransferase [Acidobacteriota bacterium]|nr:glycosyltransferase [Acidobacteriota bacterium]
MKRVLMVSPHFPPDTSAGTHRVRLLAPHLATFGWEPVIVTVDPRDYESRLDPGLAELVPSDLRVVRSRAWQVETTRRLGVGDLGLRAMRGLYQTCAELLRRERFDVLFITIYPSYPALLGPMLKRRFGIPFVLDYQDPWVGSWGLTVGGGANGQPDFKSRLSRFVATKLEPMAARAADAITAVSAGTYEAIRERYAGFDDKLYLAIPLGGEPADFTQLRNQPRANPYFDPADGLCHLCYVGTLLPLGFETLRALLKAAALLKVRQPELYQKLRLHFFGTSNQAIKIENFSSTKPHEENTKERKREREKEGIADGFSLSPSVTPSHHLREPSCAFVDEQILEKLRVLPVAREIGVADCVTELAPRIDYLDALTVQTQASAILMLGSSERHYTASKLYPGLLAARPILALYHEASSVVEILRRAAKPPSVRVVTYGDSARAESRVEAIYDELAALVANPVYDPADVAMDEVKEFSAESLAGKLAEVFDGVRSSAFRRQARQLNATA